MGAATSIMFMAEHHDIAHAAVLDSGFAMIQDVINQVGGAMMQIPPPFMQMLMMQATPQIH
jgi:hypothetical protein